MRLKIVCLVILGILVIHMFSLFYNDFKGYQWIDGNKLALKVVELSYEMMIPAFSTTDSCNHFIEDTFVKLMLPGIGKMQKCKSSDTWKYESDYIEDEIVVWNEIQPEIERELMDQNTVEIKEEKEETIETIEEVATVISDQYVRKVIYQSEQLHDAEYVKEHFFSVDPTTSVSLDQLSFDKLVEYDASVEKKEEQSGPQLLIYHTHSQETYVDSDPKNTDTTIVGVGKMLAELLRDKYGYQVLHDTESYDYESRDYAYANAAKGLQRILTQYPSIEVMIDIHRDAVKEDTRLVYENNGKTVARFMFFNGMSYTNAMGKLERLPNPYLEENMAFAFQCMLASEEYFPGITRKTYLKGYRYNMQYRPRSLLIEIGAQTNTYEEALNTCEPLAYILNLVLSGEYPEKEKLR